jgi:protein-disulfide isomerase
VKRNTLGPILAVVGGAIVLVIALVIASQVGGKSSNPSPSQINVGSVNPMLEGIPQQGIALGSPKAPVTLTEFADPQCPGCAAASQQVLPELIQRYVRTGKLRILYEGQTFLGGDSERLLRLALAAAQQQKLWNVIELFYLNQGAENSGYATDSYLKAIAKAAGLDPDATLAASQTSAVVPGMLAARKAFEASGFDSTPSFLLGRTGAPPSARFTANAAFDTAAIESDIQALLAGK